ncbi:hypothetical protein [uncultured Nostoc sp.]|uniref:hypothetical protein n=1 Tax=uncultured Nostoc sp. TaxID=340711 RepID=UPI0035CC9FD3
MRQRQPEQLDAWLNKAKNSSVSLLRSFAVSLESDYDAVKAGVTMSLCPNLCFGCYIPFFLLPSALCPLPSHNRDHQKLPRTGLCLTDAESQVKNDCPCRK